MLSFAQLSSSSTPLMDIILRWPDILRPAATLYNLFFAGTWSIWILLFGIYFPERLGVDRRWPWLKWLIIAPIVVEALGTALYTVGLAEGVQVLASIRAWLLPLNKAALLLQMVAVSCFFFSVGTKIGQASSADARRRLKLLINGTSLALTPLFFLAVYGLIRGFEKIPEGYWFPALLPLALFPITLAYVIVVQRALDVRVGHPAGAAICTGEARYRRVADPSDGSSDLGCCDAGHGSKP